MLIEEACAYVYRVIVCTRASLLYLKQNWIHCFIYNGDCSREICLLFAITMFPLQIYVLVLTTKIGTGRTDRSDRCQTGLPRIRVQLELFVDLDL